MSRRRSARQLEPRPVSIAGRYCPTGKIGYHSREDAQAQIAYLQRLRAPGEVVESREYRCTLGGGLHEHYHLTSDRQRTEQAS